MKFAELQFKERNEELVKAMGNQYRGRQALYNIDGYTISVISGFGAWADESHPYELWWWSDDKDAGRDPFGHLTAQDVEWFINNKCYKDYHKFEDYLYV